MSPQLSTSNEVAKSNDVGRAQISSVCMQIGFQIFVDCDGIESKVAIWYAALAKLY